MKNVFIVLLIAAIGAGVYFFLLKKKTTLQNGIDREQIIGKWKMQSLEPGNDSTTQFMLGIIGMVDSNYLKYQYEFEKSGTIKQYLDDSLYRDNSRYKWGKEKQLVWKEDATDSTGTVFGVLTLNKDSLWLRGKDSTQVLFVKLK